MLAKVLHDTGISVVDTDMDNVVEVLLGLSLHQVVDGIQDPTKLAEQVQNAKDVISAMTRETQRSAGSPSPTASHDSRLLDPNALNATPSAPEHPSTPLSLSASLSTSPHTSSPSGSIAPGASEKDHLMAVVVRLKPKNATEITDLLMSLSRRERALCLFNAKVLKNKVAETNEVLEVVMAEHNEMPMVEKWASRASTPATPITPHSKFDPAPPDDSPQTPDLSSRGPSAMASPTSPPTPGPGTTHTFFSLACLPVSEIMSWPIPHL